MNDVKVAAELSEVTEAATSTGYFVGIGYFHTNIGRVDPNIGRFSPTSATLTPTVFDHRLFSKNFQTFSENL